MGTHPDIAESDRIIGSSTLLAQARDALRLKHYSIRTEVAYLGWIERYILFHAKRHPRDMGEADVEALLNALAVRRQVSASTQSQALNMLVFLYETKTLAEKYGARLVAVRYPGKKADRFISCSTSKKIDPLPFSFKPARGAVSGPLASPPLRLRRLKANSYAFAASCIWAVVNVNGVPYENC
jgi:hypothetical protein